MVVDTSALVAIVFDEPERERFVARIALDAVRMVSAVTWVEASLVVLARKGPQGLDRLDRFLDQAAVERVSFDEHQAMLARRALALYGRGRHPAGLNFGDCFAYALSKSTGEPLLFKGDDFGRMDVAPALD